MEELLKQIIERLDRMEGAISTIKGDVSDVKGQALETNQIVKALLHQSDVQKAQIDALTNTAAKIEGEVKNLRADINAIETITAKNWTDIVQLKSVKQA